MAVDKFVTKDYLLDQFEGYDREIASNKYVSSDALDNKVDKVSGKGLSKNDYSDSDKAIVNGVTGALANKQDLLIPGTGISIENNVISATGGSEIVEMTYAEYQALTPAQKNDGTVRYVIDYPSGGGGSGAGYTKELVYDSGSDTTYAPVSSASDNLNVDVSFTQDISKFDQLMVVFSCINDGNYTVSGRLAFFDVNLLLTANKAYDYSDYFHRWFRFKVKDATTFAYFSSALNENLEGYQPRIYKIYGIKFGGGSLPDYSTTEHKTGQKWIDGKDIYECVLPFKINGAMDSAWTIASNNNFTHPDYPTGTISQVIMANVIRNQSTGFQTRMGAGTGACEYNPTTGMFYLNFPEDYTSSWIIFQYTKV